MAIRSGPIIGSKLSNVQFGGIMMNEIMSTVSSCWRMTVKLMHSLTHSLGLELVLVGPPRPSIHPSVHPTNHFIFVCLFPAFAG